MHMAGGLRQAQVLSTPDIFLPKRSIAQHIITLSMLTEAHRLLQPCASLAMYDAAMMFQTSSVQKNITRYVSCMCQ